MAPFKNVVTTQADWQQGTLDGVMATAAGDLELWRPDVYGPFDSDFNLVRKDDTTVAPLSGHVATLHPGEGRFGGAVAVEEGTTNLANNPTFSGTVGAAPSGWHSDVTIRQDDFFGQLINVAELLCVSGNAYEDFGTGIAYPLAYNTTYTISFWARGTMEPSYELSANRGIASATWKSKPPMSLQWQRYEVTIVTASSGSIYPFWWHLPNVNNVNVGKWVRIARIQLEQKPFATSFVAGTRAAGRLMYSGAIPSNEGTLLIWAKKNTLELNTIDGFRKILDAQSPRIDFQWDQHGDLTANFGGANLSIPDPAQDLDWHQYAITYSGRTVKMYFDGQLVASGQAQEDLVNFSELCVGARWDGRGAGNALYDELLILPYAASEEEIQHWYAQSLPLRRAPSGARTSSPLDLSTVGTAAGSSISWAATTPEGTSVTVETRLSLDGGSTWGPWQVCTNGGAIPGITPGMDLSNARIQTRVTLSTTNTTVTPQLHDLILSIGSQVTALPPTSFEVGISRQTLFPLDIEIRVSWDRQIHVSLYVGRPDGVTWADVSDYLASATVELGDISGVGTGQSGVDGVVRRASFVLRNDRAGMPGDSFSPRDRQSAWNQFDVDGDGTPEYAPLLWPNREVVLQVAVTLPGAEPGPFDWITLFHGLLGDAIRTSGPTVECEARDLAKRLQDTYILTPREYGSEAGTPAEDVIQQIIDDNLGPGEVTLYFPSGTASDPRPITESPGFMVTPYVVEYMSVWDAIQQVAAQFGWFLGYRWHPNTGRMQLILMEPPRNKDATTADFHFSWEDDIYTQDLEITDRDIRNIVTVTFRNSTTGDRESVTVQDDASITTYGPRAMQIEEGDASLIDTPEEAERLANAALADLKDMTATTHIQMPLLPTLDVFSGIVVTDPRLSSTDDFFGVESVRHVLDFEARQFRTEAVAAGRVIGGHHRWLRMQTRPGKKDMPYTTADRIMTGTFELTPDKQIATPDDQVRVGPDGIEMQIPEQGGTRWTPSGLVFTRADGTESGYVRAAVAGIAEDGDYVPLNFSNEPVVVLSPARAIVYNPSVNTLQKLRLEAVDVSPEGFRVVAKLMQHGGPGRRTVFPNTRKYRWYTGSGSYYCTDGGHVLEASARMWSEHRLRDVGDKRVFTTGPDATGVVVRVREMLHAHAYAGNYTAENRITYRLRIRQAGSSTWLATLGPFTRSIKSVSPLLRTHLEWRHPQVAHMFSNLAPAQYEVEIEITGKSLASRWGDNTADACYLLVEEIEEMTEAEIQVPEPITVHYVAFESDSPGNGGDD